MYHTKSRTKLEDVKSFFSWDYKTLISLFKYVVFVISLLDIVFLSFNIKKVYLLVKNGILSISYD